jgi:hypothetical protein
MRMKASLQCTMGQSGSFGSDKQKLCWMFTSARSNGDGTQSAVEGACHRGFTIGLLLSAPAVPSACGAGATAPAPSDEAAPDDEARPDKSLHEPSATAWSLNNLLNAVA